MSTRNIKKVRERLERLKYGPKPEEPLEEFEPQYVQKTTTYDGLEVSSGTEGEQSSDELNVQPCPVKNKKRNNRKKRNKNKKAAAAIEQENEEIDEIDKVVAEVNQLLGEPTAPPPEPPKKDNAPSVMHVYYKHTNVENELFRLFGPDEEQDKSVRKQRDIRFKRRHIIEIEPEHKFTTKGYRMVLLDNVDGIRYYKFEHDPNYSRKFVETLQNLWPKYHDIMNISYVHILNDETIEAVIENCDTLYLMEAASAASSGIEGVLYFLEGVFHPKFNISEECVRLEYIHVENRPFHIAILKYLHVLTNKACHRTALELAKMLVNLDPSDPLAMIFIIDMIALRAREHQWFMQLYDHWKDTRDAKRLYNMRYSYAMSMFHVATKTKDKELMEQANECIQEAILEFPYVVLKLMVATSHTNATVTNCKLFSESDSKTSDDLKALMQFYAKYISGKWREPNVWDWFIKNVLEVVNLYNDNPHIRTRADDLSDRVRWLFRTVPIEIKRHLSVMTSMAELLVDKELPYVERTLSFNPYPGLGKSIDVHNYYRNWTTRSPFSSIVLG